MSFGGSIERYQHALYSCSRDQYWKRSPWRGDIDSRKLDKKLSGISISEFI